MKKATTGLQDAPNDIANPTRANPTRAHPIRAIPLRTDAHLRRHRLSFVRRTGGADRPDAPRDPGRKEMGRRSRLPSRAVVLHAFARPRGDAAGHLDRLAAARGQGRADRGRAVRPARGGGRAGPYAALRGHGRCAAGQGAFHRRAGRCHRRGDRGVDPRLETRLENTRGEPDRRCRLCGAVLLQAAVPAGDPVGGNLGVSSHQGDRKRPRGPCPARRHGAVIEGRSGLAGDLASAAGGTCHPGTRASGRNRHLLFQAGGADLWRRLCGPRLDGARCRCGQGMADPAPDDGRSGSGRNDARTADPGEPVRRFHGGKSGWRSVVRRRRGAGCAVDDLHPVVPVHLHRRALH